MDFDSRVEAGQRLAKALGRYRGEDAVVLGLPRGGVVLAAEVARGLQAPLGVVMVRKIGHPSSPEYAIGALAEEQVPVYNEQEAAGIDSSWLGKAEASAREANRERSESYYREGLAPPDMEGRLAIVVDDGMATGLTMEAAVRLLLSRGARRVVVAVPVASPESVERLEPVAGEVLVLDPPDHFGSAVGAHYRQFEQIDDAEVKALLWEVNAGV